MNHMKQSKQNSTLEYEPWFKITNYMSKYLNDHSREIINKLNKNENTNR
jgi:hypothetical protein